MPGKIFISYRRDDDPSAAARVCDGLAAKFGRASVFMDVDKFRAGQRFDEELAKALAECDVLIAIIGPRWMELLESRASIDDRDFVREEIAGALKRKIVVIPVRVGREGQLAPLPRQDDLPGDIRDLVLHQKHDVTHENFGRDIDKLVKDIRAVRGSSNKLERAARALRWAPGIVAAAGAIFVALVGAENVRDAGGWLRGFFEEPERPPIEMTPTKSSSQKQAADLVASKSEADKAAMIKEAQTLLAELGYDPGEADGLRGVQTTDAIKEFQRDMGTASRKIFGQVDQRLISALRVAKRTKLREERRRARQLAEKEAAAADAEAERVAAEQRKEQAEEAERKRLARSLSPNATSIPETKAPGDETACRQLPAALTSQVPLKEGDEFCSATGRKTARVERIHDQSIRFLVNGTKSLTCREGEACAFDWSPNVHFRVTARSDPARGIQPVGALLPR
ncbi:MAG: TIR domain-containing protein [Alphaproteobacteria bacterium]|nr:TIR domain-containing protein [Alphaproteobacteria bacterium]